MKLNFNKTEAENLLAHINETNSLSLSLSDVDFGTISDVVDGSSWDRADPNKTPISPNSKITITAKSTAASIKGSKEIQYRRIDIAKQWDALWGGNIVRYPDNVFSTFDETTIKEWLKTRLPYLASSINVTVSVNSGEGSAEITVTPIPNSLIYLPDNTNGGTLTPFKITLSKTKSDLNTMISKSTLDGFTYETSVTLPAPVIPGFEYSGG